MSDDPKCVAGCVPFYGGEKKHHKDCPHYPESLTKATADRIEELEAKLEAIEALMVRRIQSVSHNSTSYNQDTLSDSRKRKNSVREYALSLALGEIRQVIKGQTGGIDDRIPN